MRRRPDGPPTTFVDRVQERLAEARLRARIFGGPTAPVTIGGYRIERYVGAGAMGVVYEAVDERSGTTVALKTLRQLDPELLYRLKREFRSLRGLDHPNLVKLYDLVVEGDHAFFTMQLVDGIPFDRYVRDDDAARGRLRTALRGLADGVHALHGAGIVHRDLKPSNALVDCTGTVHILDFGLASDVRSDGAKRTTAEGFLLGTAAYMAPEQAAGRAATRAADWYAVGAILYEALCGDLPFSGSVLDIVAAKQHMDPVDPRERHAAAPSDLSDLAMALLHRDTGRRAGAEQVRATVAPEAEPSEPGAEASVESFVGRDAELAELERLADAPRDGHPVVVAVSGSSGIGKTRLVTRFLEGLPTSEGRLVLRARCYEHESIAFKAIDPIVDELSRHLRARASGGVDALLPRDVRLLSRLFPVLERVPAVAAAPDRAGNLSDVAELRSRAFGALRELLARITDRQPVVIFIDDLQWCDTDSVEALAAMLSPPDPPGLMLIVAHRDGQPKLPEALVRARRILQRVSEWGTFQELVVSSLSSEHATQLAATLLGREHRDEASRLCAEAEGNPFLLHAMARHWRREPGSSESSLLTVIQAGMRGLTDRARELLQVVAVASRPMPVEVAVAAAGHPSPDELTWLTSACWIKSAPSPHGTVVETFHDRIRETLRALLDASELARLHRRLAEAFEAHPVADPEDLAVHWDHAGETGKAVVHARRAAVAAMEGLAFGRAARLFAFVLDRTDPADAAERRALGFALGCALEAAWRGPEAAAAFLAASEGAREEERIDRERRAAACLLASGHVARGLELAKRLLADVGIVCHTDPMRALASTVYWRGRLRLRGTGFTARARETLSPLELLKIDTAHSLSAALGFLDTNRSASLSAQAAFRALELGEPERVVRALRSEAAHSASVSPRGTRWKSLLESAEALARRGGADFDIAAALTRGVGSAMAGNWADAREDCRRGLLVVRSDSTVLLDVVVAEAFSAWALFALGDWSRLAEEAAGAARKAEQQQNLLLFWSVQAAWGPLRHLLADDVDPATRLLEEVRETLPTHGFIAPHFWSLIGTSLVRLYANEWSVLRREFADAWPGLRSSLLLMIPLVRMQMVHFRAAAAVGAAAEMRAGQRALWSEAEGYGRKLLGIPVVGADAHGWTILAAVDRQRGRDARAVDRLATAESGFLAAGMRAHAAITRMRRGELLAGDVGGALAAEGCSALEAEGGRNARRLANIVAPGFAQ